MPSTVGLPSFLESGCFFPAGFPTTLFQPSTFFTN
jgi:hypothetical protein